ncbi:hypothetical protein HHL23_11020 [Chryseobacterium sp. RP-3-3]|uniref:Lipoprotein n=1 Tax=Chryseobacterium antibioticum TaxID=2728847 RepID=A0A7Y0AN26_9FLAO|nr:hypothetical protein [Chryseobacterium antibioticum]NML70329.1 hypothetical protein [Chryseobacterium antibioticum]
MDRIIEIKITKKSYLVLICLSAIFSCKNSKASIPDNNGGFFEKSTVADTITSTKKTSTLVQKSNIDKKWYGIYKTRLDYGKIGGMNVGWDLEININSDNITASGSGYQIGFKDEVTAMEEGNKLILKYKKNLDGYTLGENMNPEFILIKDNRNFYIQSEWIDSDIITKPDKNGFKISKEN